jgi:hypothetical protein
LSAWSEVIVATGDKATSIRGEPMKPSSLAAAIRIVIAAAATLVSGPIDISDRIVSDSVSKTLGQSVTTH